MSDVTCNDFLGGQVQAWQPVKGYRAGVDAVFLAAAVPAKPGQRVLELGCGVGVASLCLAARVKGVSVTGIERETLYANLAARNGVDVVQADIAALPQEVLAQSYDHVIFNPPYFDRALGAKSEHHETEAARGEHTSMSTWIDVATRRLKPKGQLTLIQNASRLPDVLSALDDRMGAITVQPFTPRIGRAAHLVIVQARKSSKAPFVLNAPIVVHEGNRHERDEEDYTPIVRAILRDGAPLSLNP